jgi:isocitrate lyase
MSVHYVSPTDDNLVQSRRMQDMGIFTEVATEVGHIIVARVDTERVKELLSPDRKELQRLISRG